MNDRRFRFARAALLALIVCLAAPVLLCGCATSDTENQAYRPWGGGQDWHGTLPSGMTEGR